MIEAGSAIFGINPLFAIVLMGVLMVVNRAGASMVFFDVVGRFQAKRLVKDAETSMTLFNAIMLDAFANMQDSINVLGGTFSNFVESMLPMTEAVEEAEIQFQKFTQATGADLERTKQQIKDLGTEFGYTGDEALDAASRMAQLASVLGEGMTPTGTQLGMEFGLISGMGTEEAMTRLINLNQQIGFMQKGTEDLLTVEERQLKIRQNTLVVLDQLNTIENRSAATMEQITFVMNQFASQANLANESIAAMAAQSAALIEAGEEQGKAGRALKMVYARLGGDIGGATKHLNEMGIATHDVNGNMRALSEILSDLNKEWEGMEAGQKQTIAQTVAGNRHYTRFIKLMENYDRVQQLTLEGQFAMYPAMDEVNQRLDSQILKYQEAEAALFNMKATLGETFLPAMTEALETQTNFTAVMVEFAEATGGAGGFLYQFGEDMTNLIAPIMGVAVNIGALVVAMQTQKQVTRAMAGDELVLSEAYGNSGLQYTNMARAMTELGLIRKEEIAKIQIEEIAIKELTAAQREQATEALAAWISQQGRAEREIAQKTHLLKVNDFHQAQLKIKLRDMGQEAFEAEGLDIKLRDLADAHENISQEMQWEIIWLKQLIALRDKEAQLLAGDIHLANEQKLKDQNADIQSQASLAKTIYTTSGAMIGLGSAVMMFSKSQESMRIGMVITTMGMAAMTVWQLKLIFNEKLLAALTWKNVAAMLTRNKLMWESIFAFGATTIATIKATLSSIAHTIALEIETIQTWGLKFAIDQLVASFMSLHIVTGGALIPLLATIAVVVIGVLALTNAVKEASAATEELNEATMQYSAQTFHDLMAEEAWTLNSVTAAINDKKAAIDALSGSQTAVGEERIRLLTEEVGALQDINQLMLANEIMLGDTESIEQNADAILSAMDDFQKKQDKYGYLDEIKTPKGMGGRFPGAGKSAAAFGANILSILNPLDDGVWLASRAVENSEKTLNDLKNQYAQAARFIELTGVDSAEGFAVALQSNFDLWLELGIVAEEEMSDISSSIETASEALYDFNNAREELFYGMSASNITGDLVRQVVQRGVENLIAHTEVLMTNNFNGMTTQQAADEILTLIERGAGLDGYNLSTVSGQNMA